MRRFRWITRFASCLLQPQIVHSLSVIFGNLPLILVPQVLLPLVNGWERVATMTDSLPPIVSCAIILAHAVSKVVCKYRTRKGERNEKEVKRDRQTDR